MTTPVRRSVYDPPPMCTCGHSKFVHFITASKTRGRCSSWHNGRCQCRGYKGEE